MKTASAASEVWCRSWDETSDALLAQLGGAIEMDRVHELLRARQRLMTANPRPTPGRGEAVQRSWLDAAQQREERIREAFEHYRARIRAARHSMQGSESTRRRFAVDEEVIPASRLDRRI